MSIPQAESSRRVVRSPLRRSKWASLRMALTCLPCVRSSTCVNCTTRTSSRCVHFARICAPHHSRVLTRLSCLLCRLLAFCLSLEALGCVLFEDESEPRPRVPRHRPRDDHQGPFARLSPRGHQKLDGHDVPWSRILSSEFHPPSSAYDSFSPCQPFASWRWRSILLLRLSSNY